MENSPAVEVRDLSVVRGGHEVLHGLSFVVPRGSVCGLLGPSGCGKTTLMRAIVGVQAGVTGEVHVLGEPAGSPGLRRRVGYVTQSPAVYGDLTVRENVDYFADVYGVERAARPARSSTWGWPTGPTSSSAPCRAGRCRA
jgi:ABC-2 type transport system ATP-binding protein